jgi:hypothetical protein
MVSDAAEQRPQIASQGFMAHAHNSSSSLGGTGQRQDGGMLPEACSTLGYRLSQLSWLVNKGQAPVVQGLPGSVTALQEGAHTWHSYVTHVHTHIRMLPMCVRTYLIRCCAVCRYKCGPQQDKISLQWRITTKLCTRHLDCCWLWCTVVVGIVMCSSGIGCCWSRYPVVFLRCLVAACIILCSSDLGHCCCWSSVVACSVIISAVAA